MCTQQESELCLIYMDEITLGGRVCNLKNDHMDLMKQEGAQIGLKVNKNKPEIVCGNSATS